MFTSHLGASLLEFNFYQFLDNVSLCEEVGVEMRRSGCRLSERRADYTVIVYQSLGDLPLLLLLLVVHWLFWMLSLCAGEQ